MRPIRRSTVHRATSNALAVHLHPDLVCTIDLHVGVPDALDLRHQVNSSRCRPGAGGSDASRWRAAWRRYADGANCRTLQIGSTPNRPRCSSTKALITSAGGRAPPGRKTRWPASGSRWPRRSSLFSRSSSLRRCSLGRRDAGPGAGTVDLITLDPFVAGSGARSRSWARWIRLAAHSEGYSPAVLLHHANGAFADLG